ncbi:HAD-like domain-containing protein [Multifurca ochricompacta]|uniref:HAD-like domain-containing protein n=1 Tax=Multifurca ochricompacta TaxID=376703 RepID=A0AAD4LZ42_9AGAM|nr:HAD-like domain-containing protein [Multifurca ochricompacta]
MLFGTSRALSGARSCHGWHWRFLSHARPQANPNHLLSLGFAFDIDGVLLHGANVLPEAKRALSILEGNNSLNRKIPYILMTNGGGVSEEDRSKQLTERLGFEITPSNFMQAHTILKSFAHKYANKPVLVLGGKRDVLRKVAKSYGLKHVYTTLDVKAWNPDVWPFHDLTPEERAAATPVDFSTTPISAIFVFHDPRNWALDVQVMIDIILSRGIIDRRRPVENAPPVELVFCNPDLQWRSEFSRPRLGQGAFREAFQGVFKALTGAPYPHVQYGKPTTPTYEFGEKMLRARIEELHGALSTGCEIQPRIYMVGDNPESDIAGANAAGWSSILVRTGVYDPADGLPTHKPTYEAENVEAAVKWAIDREIARVA